MDPNNKNSCTFGGDMLAYLYAEMPGAERELFETHLAECGSCIDEFAELSNARYAVYEWQKLEFAPMETPEIVIPFAKKSIANGTFSFADKIKAAFGFSNGWAASGAGFAVIAIALAFGFVLLDRPDQSGIIAGLTNLEPSPSPVRKPENSGSQPEAAKQDQPNDGKAEGIGLSRPIQVKVSAAKPSRTDTKNGSDEKKAVAAPNRIQNVPDLSQFDEEEDETLRLADLFDEIDTK